jgi:TonB family protein
VEIRVKIPWPEDPARRALIGTLAISVLLHALLLGLLVSTPTLGPSPYVKRGEPLLVDLATDPREPAPRGDPSRPVEPAPAAPPPTAARPSPPAVAKAPPAPRATPAPRPAPPREPPPAVAPRPEPAPEALRPAPVPDPPKAPDPPAVAAAPPQPAPPAPPPGPGAAAPPAPSPGTVETERPVIAPPPGPQAALSGPRASTPSGMWRGGGLGSGRGGVEGEPVPLDTPEPRYQDYFNKIREKIRKHWTYPREAGDRGIEGDLLIEFHIAKDGRLTLVELRRSSGVEILDGAALTAVRLAQPYPPVPDDLAKQRLAINGLFRYQIVGASLLNHYIR